MQPELRSALDAFCAGVNAAARRPPASRPSSSFCGSDSRPSRPPTRSPSPSCSPSASRPTGSASFCEARDGTRELGAELAARLDPGYPRGNPVILTPQEPWQGDGLGLAEQIARVRDSIGLAVEASGSNNWAVAGARSATGEPLFAGDPHLPPSMPGITYQVKGFLLDDRFCRGAALPGLPGLLIGQNNDVAWSFTNVMADVMDLFIERIDGNTLRVRGQVPAPGA